MVWAEGIKMLRRKRMNNDINGGCNVAPGYLFDQMFFTFHFGARRCDDFKMRWRHSQTRC